MLDKTLFCAYMGKDSNSIERNQRFSWGLYGGRIKSTKSLISGENIDESWKGDTYNTSIGHLLLGKIVPPLWGSINVFQWLTQGASPGLCRSIVLKGSSTSFLINTLYCFDAVTLYLPSNTMLMCKTFFIFASINPFLINPEREQVQSR